MKTFKNSDGSFDVLIQNKLFHVKSGRSKFVGTVNEKWRAWGPQLKRTPKTVLQLFK